MIKFIEKNMGLVMNFGLIIGLVFGEHLAFFEHYVVFGLMLLLFTSLLRADFSLIRRHIKKPAQVLLLTFVKMILLPIIVYFISLLLPPEYRIAMVLLAATPAAMATPGLLAALNGKIELGFLVLILSSLLAPFLVPLVLFYTLKTNIELDVLAMMKFLAGVIILPILAALLFKRFFKTTVQKINKYTTLLITLNLFLFNIGISAPYQEILIENIGMVGWDLLVVIGLSVLFHLLALLFTFKSNSSMKMTAIIIFAYFNTGLSIVIAQQYFDANTLIITVLYELVWALGIMFLQKWGMKKA